MKTWFTSDHHFGHKNIIKYCERPWADVDEMNQGLVERWNERVGKWDNVWVLGDLCWGSPATYLPYLKELNGEKFLVPGNHDTCWDGHEKPSGKQALKEAGFHIMDGTCLVYWRAQRFLACHFPYHNDSRHDLRYAENRPRDTGEWLLHGHVHEAWKVEGRQINVGVDVWDWYPVDFDTLVDIKKEGS